MEEQLKDKVARGVAWSMAEKIGSMLLMTVVRLLILNRLDPQIFGHFAIPSAVVAVAMVVADSGFSQNLIRRKDPAGSDYKAVFVFNMAVSTLLYLLLAALAPFAARYYAMPDIARIAPVFLLLLPVSSLCSVQNAIFTRQFRFALLSKVNFLSSFASGVIAVVLATLGCGIWSLVAERLLAMGVRAVMLWCCSDWRPTGRFTAAPLREMAPFSMSLMATDLISTLYSKIPQFFFGRLYTASALGAFEQAVKIKDMPTTAAVQSVQSVTFPALARIKEDPVKFAEGYRQVMMIMAYVMFPALLGLSATARDLFDALLAPKWQPTVPYFEVVCLSGLFYSISMISYNVLKIKSRGPLIVRLEVVKKLIMTAVFAVTIPRSIMAVVWGLVVISFCEMAVNFWATLRFSQLTVGRFLRTMLPVVLASVAMYAAVRFTAAALPATHALLRVAAEIAAGGATYLAISVLFRLEAFRTAVELVKKETAR